MNVAVVGVLLPLLVFLGIVIFWVRSQPPGRRALLRRSAKNPSDFGEAWARETQLGRVLRILWGAASAVCIFTFVAWIAGDVPRKAYEIPMGVYFVVYGALAFTHPDFMGLDSQPWSRFRPWLAAFMGLCGLVMVVGTVL